jgi:ATP-dependent DNA helicase RecG
LAQSQPKKFLAIGLETLEDALLYFPVRHEDWRRIVPLSQAEVDAPITLRGTVVSIVSRRSWKKRGLTITEARIADAEQSIVAVTWFNIPYLEKTIPPGTDIFLSGVLELSNDRLQLTNPAFEKVSPDPSHQLLVPIYRSTAGLSQRAIRNVIAKAVELTSLVPDHIPSSLLQDLQLPDRPTALRHIHFPPSPELGEAALRRLQFDELLAWQIRWQEVLATRRIRPAIAFPLNESLIRSFVQRLPFQLTDDQRVASWQILQDMSKPHAMWRLLQGDVGSGKTVVAAIAALAVAKHQRQTIVLAPTTILVQQHATTFRTFLRDDQVILAVATHDGWVMGGAHEAPVAVDRETAIQHAHIIIGTHALLHDDLSFSNVGLVIVDEQQRFGVAQRHLLLEQHDQQSPHFLSMTATPIPRTWQLLLNGELELSRLQRSPVPRSITTTVLPTSHSTEQIALAEATISRNEQLIIIVPTIEETDGFGVASITSELQRWKRLLPTARIDVAHGAMSIDERDERLTAMREHQLDILIATTIIEVGIDLPAVTGMVIQNAERFGLAQIHQLRGRIARHGQHGTCLLIAGTTATKALERLTAAASTTDGYKLSEFDHTARGAGDIYGLRQSGLPSWKLATLDDEPLLILAKKVAQQFLRDGATAAIMMDERWMSPGEMHRE